jgi:hypothetical protein
MTLLLGLLLALTPSSPEVLRVGEFAYTAAEVAARANVYRKERGFTPDGFVRRLKNEGLLLTEASRRKLALEPRVMAAIAAARQEALAAEFGELVLRKDAEPTDDEVRAAFHAGADMAKLLLIVVASETEARAIRTRIDQGADWALEATRSLDSAVAAKKGETGTLPRFSIDPALADVVFRASSGETLGPVQLGMGWGVAKVLERSLGDETILTQKRPEFASIARKSKLRRVREHFLGKEYARRGITVDSPLVKALSKRPEVAKEDGSATIATIEGRPVRLQEAIPYIARFEAAFGTGHVGGLRLLPKALSTFIDDRLLADAATAQGLLTRPEVARRIAQSASEALALAMAETLLRESPSNASPGDQQKRMRRILDDLSNSTNVWVDEKAAIAAATLQ